MSRYSVEGRDLLALSDRRIRSLFTAEEFETLLERIRLELLPRLYDVRDDWESDYDKSETPDDHMGKLLEDIEALEKTFMNDPDALEIIEGEHAAVEDWISERTSDEGYVRSQAVPTTTIRDLLNSERSIFSDIDAN